MFENPVTLSASVTDLTASITQAIAPAFLLVAIGSLLNVMTTRLGRVIDRARVAERLIHEMADNAERERIRVELKALDRRMFYSHSAINLSAAAALMIACTVALIFAAHITVFNPTRFIAILFIVATVALVAAILSFLAEISIATRTIRVRSELLQKK